VSRQQPQQLKKLSKLTPERIAFKPIGTVKTQASGDEVKDRTHLSEIQLHSKLLHALEGIDGFSHVFVLFWLHEITARECGKLKIHPRGRADIPLVGVFAARSKCRPNPIGLTLCQLVKVEGTVLTVRGLDAYDGTPVLDLKPYDSWDYAVDAKMPEWWMKLEEEKNKPTKK
jgi:tRNA-Thr(GGU) m(6)t(6)A37 methyltransferase TsaA